MTYWRFSDGYSANQSPWATLPTPRLRGRGCQVSTGSTCPWSPRRYAIVQQRPSRPNPQPTIAIQCLSDVVESLIGALYVSDNFFEMGVGRFFESVFKPFLEAHVRLQTLSTNPKITLLELLQAEGCQNNSVVKQPQPRQNMPVQMDGKPRVCHASRSG